jgi:hypothetical protein
LLKSNEEGLVIATGGEEGEKVSLKICLTTIPRRMVKNPEKY